MALNICDAIERFLLESLGEEHSVLLSRNSLAAHFDCAPSQINYVPVSYTHLTLPTIRLV